MSSQSKSHPSRIITMLAVMIAAVCTIATLAAAQEGPAPKWELYADTPSFTPARTCTANFQERCSR